MGGRVINVDLDGRETLNPWDLPEGEAVPSNEKTAFLKNLTRHMLGDSHNSDTSLLDNVLTDAIGRVYKRCAIRYSNPIPTFNDLREELANWRDAEKMQRTIDEAHLAAIKLRSWTEGASTPSCSTSRRRCASTATGCSSTSRDSAPIPGSRRR